MYKVVRCPNCKEWIVTKASKCVRCPACGRRYKMQELRIWFIGDATGCREFIRRATGTG